MSDVIGYIAFLFDNNMAEFSLQIASICLFIKDTFLHFVWRVSWKCLDVGKLYADVGFRYIEFSCKNACIKIFNNNK